MRARDKYAISARNNLDASTLSGELALRKTVDAALLGDGRSLSAWAFLHSERDNVMPSMKQALVLVAITLLVIAVVFRVGPARKLIVGA